VHDGCEGIVFISFTQKANSGEASYLDLWEEIVVIEYGVINMTMFNVTFAQALERLPERHRNLIRT
jgi:hypothetical protein